MQVFENCLVVLEVKDLPFKEKKRLKLSITDNGGCIAYVVNKQCTHVITNNLANVSSNRQRSIQKYQVPVVGVEYVHRCLEKGALLSVKECSPVPFPRTNIPSQTNASPSPSQQDSVFKVTGQTPVGERSRDQPKPQASAPQQMEIEEEGDGKEDEETESGTYLGKHRIPNYPSNFDVAKYSILEKVGPNKMWSVLELHSSSDETGRQYRVVRCRSEGPGGQAMVTRDALFHYPSSEKALSMYDKLEKELLRQDFKRKTTLPPQFKDMGSSKLHQLLLEEKMNSGAISQEVGVFVELLWTEALGCLGNILKIPLTSISLNDVSRAEGLLLQIHKALKEGSDQKQLAELMAEFYTLLPHKEEFAPTMREISLKLDLCQLIRDMLKVSEATLWNPTASCLGKYRALRCSIEPVPPESPDFLSVSKLLWDRPVQIQQVFRVGRTVELQAFRDDLGNVQSLLHSSAPSNFVGILSRGLLLPRVGVEHHGIDRTDLGNLGGGIYFSDSLSTSLKYSKPGATDGSRLLLVCRVALGQCKDLCKKDPSLSSAPEGYNSVHGVRRAPAVISDFEDDEYVVYQTDQVQMEYVVQFTLNDEPVKTFQPTVDLSSDVAREASASDLLAEGEEDSIGRYKKRLEEVTAGLLDNTGQPLPLKAVHVKCKLMDLLTQVVIFQSYTNLSQVPIEAKYVFPLDESAAVCGFEAFINGKHVVGQVKEKEQARREYRRAVQRGHGAYLMDQDAPDVFTISVGNLPPGATVLIKVTYITELVVREGSLLFSLPGSVAPWQQSKALNQRTQVSVEKVCVNELKGDGIFTLDMSIEMPYEIWNLSCVTHRIKIKKTDCKAVVSLLPGQTLGPGGFQLSFTLSQVHLPRMWVENHPDKDSQACMLVFYPHFEPRAAAGPGGGGEGGEVEVVILLDTSESMRGVAMQDARRIAAQLLKTLRPEVRVNILSFGTVHKELFLSSQCCSKALLPATKFVMSSPPVGGSTELWRPLRSLSLLPPSSGIRNLLLISDGHVQNEALTLKLVRESIQHTRVFTCGVSPTANRHMLRALAQAGGGAYEFFDTKTKHTWMEKVSSQARRMASPGCSSVSVKWQQFNPAAAPPTQAPAQLNALFSGCHTLVYGFVPHCTQATLFGRLSEQEIETVVSTSELQKTKGTLLHKLTARAVIRDYEDGSLHADEAEHEGKKEELKSFIIELSKEYSIVTQYTSFVAIEERDAGRPDVGFTDIPKLVAEEDVDFLPYLGWEKEKDAVPYAATVKFCVRTHTQTREIQENVVFNQCEVRSQGSISAGVHSSSEDISEQDEEESESLLAEPELLGKEFCEDESDFAPPDFALPDSAPPQPGLDPFNLCAREIGAQYSRKKSRFSLPGPGPDRPPRCRRSCVRASGASIPAAPPAFARASGASIPAAPPAFAHASGASIPAAPPAFARASGASIPAAPPAFARASGASIPAAPPAFACASGASIPAAPPAFARASGASIPAAPPAFARASGAYIPAAPPAFARAPVAYIPAALPASQMRQQQKMAETLVALGSSRRCPPMAMPHIMSDRPPRLPRPVSNFVLASDGYIPAALPASQMCQQQKMVETLAMSADSLPCPPMAMPHIMSDHPTPPPPPPACFRRRGLHINSSISTGLHPPSHATETQQKQQQQQQIADPEVPPLDSATVISAYPTRPRALKKAAGRALSNRLEEGAVHLGFGASQFPQPAGPSFLNAPSLCVQSLPFGDEASTLGIERPSQFGGPPIQVSSFGAGPGSAFTSGYWRPPTTTLVSGSPGFKPAGVYSGVSFESLEWTSGLEKGLTYRLKSMSSRRKDRARGVSWAELFDLQHQDGYWECSEKLGFILHLDLVFFASVFLKEKGIASLGVRAGADILKLVATLLVLQLLRLMGLAEGDLLKTLFRLKDTNAPTSLRGEAVKRAVEWVSRADRQYPCLCTRLELGLDWESVTRQLLGADSLHVCSPLRPVLERTRPILAQ
ncbi:protein mono-ADP-ribosyltransferase PARP4 isoform X2 [Anguilla anguilla]|uniref:protein mono-ADP-ribosyltransferase PARP4 isoform X2 n=1 Tax=Anguilla anguilla TaxID=7936 RepID=UPI0015A84403|nr:protein mono-ADP-ribosyltransferase PARP4 isoform X2 [Anguilla anguilla]